MPDDNKLTHCSSCGKRLEPFKGAPDGRGGLECAKCAGWES